jgi:hypothetical protein
VLGKLRAVTPALSTTAGGLAAEAATTWGTSKMTLGLTAAAATASVLAALLRPGRPGANVDAELLSGLREAGLITYPPRLLWRLLEKLPEVFERVVLPRVSPADRAVLAQVGPPWLAVVLASGLPRAGKTEGVPLKIKEFCGSVRRLAWARENGCGWDVRVCQQAAARGRLKVLIWAREHGCPWDEDAPDEPESDSSQGDDSDEDPTWTIHCCALAASGGHLKVLKWLRKHGCPWDEWKVARGPLRADT